MDEVAVTPATEDDLIKATSDLFIAAMFSAPKNEPILRKMIIAVMIDSGHPPGRRGHSH